MENGEKIEHLQDMQQIYLKENNLKTFGNTIVYENGVLKSQLPDYYYRSYDTTTQIVNGQNALSFTTHDNRLLALNIDAPGELEHLIEYLDVQYPKTWTLCNGDGTKVLFFKEYHQPKSRRTLLPFKISLLTGHSYYVLPDAFDYDGPKIKWHALYSPFTMPEPAPTPNWLKLALGCSFIDISKSEIR